MNNKLKGKPTPVMDERLLHAECQVKLDQFCLRLQDYLVQFEAELSEKITCAVNRGYAPKDFRFGMVEIPADGVNHHRRRFHFRQSIEEYIATCTRFVKRGGSNQLLFTFDNEIDDLIRIHENLHVLFEAAFQADKQPAERMTEVVRMIKRGVRHHPEGKDVPLFLNHTYKHHVGGGRLLKDILFLLSQGPLSSALLATHGLYSKPNESDNKSPKPGRRLRPIKR